MRRAPCPAARRGWRGRWRRPRGRCAAPRDRPHASGAGPAARSGRARTARPASTSHSTAAHCCSAMKRAVCSSTSPAPASCVSRTCESTLSSLPSTPTMPPCAQAVAASVELALGQHDHRPAPSHLAAPPSSRPGRRRSRPPRHSLATHRSPLDGCTTEPNRVATVVTPPRRGMAGRHRPDEHCDEIPRHCAHGSYTLKPSRALSFGRHESSHAKADS